MIPGLLEELVKREMELGYQDMETIVVVGLQGELIVGAAYTL